MSGEKTNKWHLSEQLVAGLVPRYKSTCASYPSYLNQDELRFKPAKNMLAVLAPASHQHQLPPAPIKITNSNSKSWPATSSMNYNNLGCNHVKRPATKCVKMPISQCPKLIQIVGSRADWKTHIKATHSQMQLAGYVWERILEIMSKRIFVIHATTSMLRRRMRGMRWLTSSDHMWCLGGNILTKIC